MLRLPSGQTVGILSERARLHAEHKSIRLLDNPSNRELYPLVDIIFRVNPQCATPLKPYDFSGYTLGDEAWLGSWPEPDREAFTQWLTETPQRQEIERARLRINCRVLPERVYRYDYGSKLFSALYQRIVRLPLISASPQQWKQTVLNMLGQGIRREEIVWCGILTFLYSAIRIGKKKVFKEEILERIDFSDIRIEVRNDMERKGGCSLRFIETAKRLSQQEAAHSQLALDKDDVAVVRWLEPNRQYRIGVIWRQGRALLHQGGKQWFLLGADGRAVSDVTGRTSLFENRIQAEAAANTNACQRCLAHGELEFSSTYEYLSLDGGGDYREWVVTLPEYSRSFFGAHHYDRNILLHMRSKIRHDDLGRKLLFIEEIQSDWHQSAGKFGYAQTSNGQVATAPFRKEWLVLGLKLMLIHAVKMDCEGLSWADGDIHQLRYGKDMPMLRRIYDVEIPKILQGLSPGGDSEVTVTNIATRRPWLQAERGKKRWRVIDAKGRFRTQPRYSLDEAHRLMTRHSKKVQLKVPLFEISRRMHERIDAQGLPLFGFVSNDR